MKPPGSNDLIRAARETIINPLLSISQQFLDAASCALFKLLGE